MASFCTKCGTALPPNTQFCTACGAPAGTVAGAPPLPYGQPIAATAPPPPSGNAVKIILIVVGVIVGLGMLSAIIFAIGVWRVSRAVRATQNGDSVTLSTPSGSITAGRTAVSDADLGVPIYPGAARAEGGMQINSGTGSMVTVVYSTSDPIGKVVDFYKSKLGENTSVIQTGNGAVITSGKENKEGLVITISPDTSANGGQTKITIMRTQSK
ncbi:MAG: zinc ribbon domain-containing protein [Silvibacterium sp.]